MKKLLVTVVGAVAALGAFAALQSDTKLQFENLSEGVITTNGLNTALGNYFSHGEGASNNTYTVNAANIGTCTVPSQIGEDPTTKALDIKTTFGNPLDVSVVAGGTAQDIDTGIYFDSLVKFTVCEDAPTQTYDNAKIVMWLQSEDGTGPTNLMVKAGSLTYAAGLDVQVTAATYECALPAGFDADAFHRVTIKSIKNITTSTTVVPGFAIYIDQATVGTSTKKWDTAFSSQYPISKVAAYLDKMAGDCFPSLIQSGDKTTLTKAGFDGTGSITDIVFTSTAPDFAADKELEEPVATVKIGDGEAEEVTSFADAVGKINNATSAAKLTLAKGLTLEEPMTFSANAEVTLDFAGFVLTNTSEFAAITNSALKLIVTNSVGTGGINCTSTGAAIYQTTATFPVDEETVNSELAITGGNFWGDEALPIDIDASYKGTLKIISGGAFAIPLPDCLVDGKVFAETPVDGLCAVIDKPVVTYTITFKYGMPYVEYPQTVAEGDLPQVPTAVDYNVEGWEFTGWDVTPVAAVANATYTAQYAPNSWAAFLGAPVNGAYEIDDLAELVKFKDGVAKLGTSGQNFRLAADIDADSLGYWDGIGTASGTNGSSGLNNCTFDGAGHTISNVKFTAAKYRGFFNQVLDSTISNLTINVTDIQQTAAAEHGYSAFAGNMKNSKIQNCVATGTIGTTAKPAMHTCGGFAVKSAGGNVFENCTNYVNIVCSLNDNPKIGGIVGLAQDAAAAFTNCWNYGDITITCKKCNNAGNGAGGLVGYGSKAITIYGGGNAGTIQSTDTTADGGTHPIKVGTIIAMQNDTSATVSGGVVAQADAAPAGAFANISGLNFATVDGNVATFVADNALAAGNTYKVMADGVTATFKFTAAGTIAFNTALATPTFAITADEGLEVTSATVGTVTTYTAAAPVVPVIDPSASKVEVTVAAESDTAAIEAVTVTPPAASGADAAEYKALFNFTATAGATAGEYTVTLTGIKEEVTTTVSTDAVKLLDGTGDGKVAVPAGLYYKVTPSTALPISGNAQTGVSDGTGVEVTKPGTTQGFIEVKLSPTPFAN